MRPFAPTRRGFLAGTAALATFGGIERLIANAASLPGAGDWNFVFAYFGGGWDILLSLDPRDPDVFRADVIQDTLTQPAYEQVVAPGRDTNPIDTGIPGFSLGAFAEPLLPHASRLAVVRGMSMDTLTHEVGRRRFLTGRPPSGLLARGSSMATILAAQLGVDAPIPNLSSKVETYNADQPSYASALRVDTVSDLVRALQPGDQDLDPLQRDRIDDLLQTLRDCDATKASALRTDALDFRDGARELVGQGLDALFDFGSSSAEMVAVRDRYGFASNDLGSAEAQAAMAATAITAGISRCVSISVTESLDTHYSDWATTQGQRQERGFRAVATLADDLAGRAHPNGGTWLDKTIILGFSEFCRTALLNASGGRDHSLSNACFLLGGGIRGGTVLGASDEIGMAPAPTDLLTGLPSASGEIVKPEHVLRALLHRVGVTDDLADLRVDPLLALLS